MSDLLPCPCGKTPKSLQIVADDQAKWGYVSGDCCGEWELEVRLQYLRQDDPERMALAVERWNRAGRAAVPAPPAPPDLVHESACHRSVAAPPPAAPQPAEPPRDMLLFCPQCGLQHIDAPEPGTDWTNPPHKSHKCHNPECKTVWRPADFATNGVASIKTSGSADNWWPFDLVPIKYATAVPASPLAAVPPDLGHRSVVADRTLPVLSGEAWRPIETAPIDGTVIVVIDETDKQPRPDFVKWFDGDTRKGWVHRDRASWISATHWMPLPAPPTNAAPLGADATNRGDGGEIKSVHRPVTSPAPSELSGEASEREAFEAWILSRPYPNKSLILARRDMATPERYGEYVYVEPEWVAWQARAKAPTLGEAVRTEVRVGAKKDKEPTR